MESWKWYVYILECNDGTYYTGMTWRPYLRYEQHQSKFGSKYTARHGVKRIAYIEEHDDINLARKREIQIKDWNKYKKEKLISGVWGRDW